MLKADVKLVARLAGLLPVIGLWFFPNQGVSGLQEVEPASAGAPTITEQACSRHQPGTITATFRWEPSGEGQQWLDISLFDNGFKPGTFIGLGPFPPTASTSSWDGLFPETPHYFRVNTLTPNGWKPTHTLAFATAGCTQHDGSPNSPILHQQLCGSTQPGTVTMVFRWESSRKGSQWLDVSLSDNGFVPGTFVGLGPLPPAATTLVWEQFSPGATYYFRVNTLTPTGWESSSTLAFSTGLCPMGARWPAKTGGNKITLTFDDCGNPRTGTMRILDILAFYGVKAIFFPTGACVHLFPEVFERVIAEGHLIGNHTYNHPTRGLTALPVEEVRWQLENGPPQAKGGYWRPPNGAHNGMTDQIAAELGYTLMMWTVDSNDWRGHSAETIASTVLSNAHPGAVVLMHVHGAHTPEALPMIIEQLLAQGYILSW